MWIRAEGAYPQNVDNWQFFLTLPLLISKILSTKNHMAQISEDGGDIEFMS